MVESILSILGSAFKIWDNKEKTKYIDKLMRLKKDYYEEINKPLNVRSDAILDDIEFQMRVLGLAFCAGVEGSNHKTSP